MTHTKDEPHTPTLYNAAWRRARAGWLRDHPLCRAHMDLGRVVQATVVDHVLPHRGDLSLFWDRGNWQSLCKLCHDSHKQRREKSGVTASCDLSGAPTDPAHPWVAAAKG